MRDRRLGTVVAFRVVLPSLLGLALCSVAIFVIILPTFERSLMSRKREMIRNLTQTVWSAVAGFDQRAARGELTQDDAQAQALEHVRGLRYGNDLKDYFWITDLRARLLVQPYRPELEGQNLSAYANILGPEALLEAIRVAREQGSGFVSYTWQRQDDPTRVIPKLSYVQVYEPWGWVIGTGVYLADVTGETGGLTRQLALGAACVLVLLTLLSASVVWQSWQFERNRRQAVEALRTSEQLLRSVVDSIPIGIYVADRELRVRWWNAAAEQFTGVLHARTRGASIVERFSGSAATALLERFRSVLATGAPLAITDYLVEDATRDQSARYVNLRANALHDARGRVTGIVIAAEEITERRRAAEERAELQEQLHQAQKMQAVGQLAGGVAHDFNNLLTVILGGIDQLRELLPPDRAGPDALDTIERAVDQASNVTRALLTFTHKLPADRRTIELCGLVDRAARLLHRLLPASIELDVDTRCVPTPYVHADATQLQQVVLNLAINARDAMPSGGRLRLAVMCTGASQTGGAADGSGAPTVCLEIGDNGTGMPPEVQARIFEPFFTTKPRGQGTGLGLAIVQSIVLEHGGQIDVRSRVGTGTTVSITLPCVVAGHADGPSAATLPPQRGNGEIVLLAEDNRPAREIMASKLDSLGYRVVQTADGGELRDAQRRHGDSVRLLILDVDLPRHSGLDCLRELRAGGVQTPIIVITGSVQTDFEDDLDGETVLLRKPFQMAELGELVSRLLHTPSLQVTDA